MKSHDLLRRYFVGFDNPAWIVFIKSEIFIATGMAWPVRSDKMESTLLVQVSRYMQLVRVKN